MVTVYDHLNLVQNTWQGVKPRYYDTPSPASHVTGARSCVTRHYVRIHYILHYGSYIIRKIYKTTKDILIVEIIEKQHPRKQIIVNYPNSQPKTTFNKSNNVMLHLNRWHWKYIVKCESKTVAPLTNILNRICWAVCYQLTYSLPTIVIISVLFLLIIINSEAWFMTHCLGLGYIIMVRVFMFINVLVAHCTQFIMVHPSVSDKCLVLFI